MVNTSVLRMVHAGFDNLPRIVVPHKMVSRIEKLKKRQELENARKFRKPLKYKSPLVISCRRPEYNHHRGQTYSDFQPKVLASHGWKHKKSVGDHMTLVPHGSNPSLLSEESGAKGWKGLSPQVLQGLQDMKIETPTKIQRLAIPKILQGHSVICAAETGSGKTLAYLLPLIELIHRQQALEITIPPRSPKAVILVPARELAHQIMMTAERFLDHVNFTPHSVFRHGRDKGRTDDIDLLVSTPAIFDKILATGEISPSNLQHLVLDEADTLLDDSFNMEVKEILQRICVEGGEPTGDGVFVTTGVQVALVGATLPRSLDTIIGDIIPVNSFTRVTTDGLHHLMPHVKQTFIRVKPSQKAEELVKLAKKSLSSKRPTMIFCNKSSTCTWLGHVLRENGLDIIIMNGLISPKERLERLERFQEGESDLMVCTDIGSRGIDTVRVTHVINFNFPFYVSDYIHRAGRVGRIGSRDNCTVTSFITHKYDVDLLWKIEIASRKQVELHNVNANIKRKRISVAMRKNPDFFQEHVDSD